MARLLDGAPSPVMRWRDAREEDREEGLRVRFSRGRRPRLTAREQRRLVALLFRGPLPHGYATDLWTTARAAQVISREFRVRYRARVRDVPVRHPTTDAKTPRNFPVC